MQNFQAFSRLCMCACLSKPNRRAFLVFVSVFCRIPYSYIYGAVRISVSENRTAWCGESGVVRRLVFYFQTVLVRFDFVRCGYRLKPLKTAPHRSKSTLFKKTSTRLSAVIFLGSSNGAVRCGFHSLESYGGVGVPCGLCFF